MRTVSLVSISLLLAVVAAVLVSRVPEQVAVGMVVAPTLVALCVSFLLFARHGGWRRSRGIKEWLLWGPVQAAPDALRTRVGQGPRILLCLSVSIAVGAISGMILVAVFAAGSAA